MFTMLYTMIFDEFLFFFSRRNSRRVPRTIAVTRRRVRDKNLWSYDTTTLIPILLFYVRRSTQTTGDDFFREFNNYTYVLRAWRRTTSHRHTHIHTAYTQSLIHMYTTTLTITITRRRHDENLFGGLRTTRARQRERSRERPKLIVITNNNT